MKRSLSIVGVLLVVLGTTYRSATDCVFSQAAAAPKLIDGRIRTKGSSATLIFRGLIVLHPDAARRYLEVGMLKAPQHEIRIHVRETSPNGVSIMWGPPALLARSQGDVWSLKFAGTEPQGVSFYHGASFDRTRGVGEARDARWLVDLEGPEFYQRQLPMNTDRLSAVLRMVSGEFYTKTRTLPLVRRKGDSTSQYFGRVANEIATDISLNQEDIVIRSEKTGSEILRLKDKPETTYEIVIENVFVGDHHLASSLNHFIYYYALVSTPKNEWFEFKDVGGADLASEQFRPVSFMPGTDRAPCMPIMLGGGR